MLGACSSLPDRVWTRRKGDRHGRYVISGDELDLETNRLCFLLRLDKDMTTCWTTLRLFGVKRYSKGLQFTTNRDEFVRPHRQKRDAYLERIVVVQLLAHRWLSAATCDTSSSRRMKSTLVPSFVPPTSTRLRYSWISSRAPLSRLPRGAGVYFPTPGISRDNADDAAAVIGLTGVACECAACEWPERPEEEEEDARKKGSKCSLRRSNSSDSGAESSNFCN